MRHLRHFERTDPADTRYLVALVSLLACLTSLPPLLGWLMARGTGLTYSGMPLVNQGDLVFYLKNIREAGEGRWLFDYTLLSGAGTPILNLCWLAVGALGRLLGTQPLVTFHIARVLLLLPLALALRAVVHAALVDCAERRVAMGVVLFGSGLGGFIPLVFGPLALITPDMGQPEFTAFGSALASPHLVASWLLQLLIIPLALKAVVHRSLRDASLAGGLSCLWFQFHPYYAPLLWAITGAMALWESRRGWRTVPWRPAVIVILGGVPSVAYHARFVLGANQEWMLDTNTLPAEPLSLVLFALAGLVVAAPFGFRLLRVRERVGNPAPLTTDQLLLWALVQFGCANIPFGFERRLLQGLVVPLALLATPALTAAWNAWGSAPGGRPFARWGLLLGTFGSATVALLVLSLRGVVHPTPSNQFFAADEAALFAWSARYVPTDDVLLAPPLTARRFAGWGGVTVYVGYHWTQSRTERTRTAEVAALYRNRDPEQIAAFLRSRGIRVLYVGPEERALGGAVERIPGLRLLFRAGERVLWGIP